MAKRKQAQKDYDIARLPATRRQLLVDICKNRSALLLDLGLLLVLFMLPAAGLNMLLQLQTAQLSRAQLSAEELAARLIELRNGGNLLLIPALAVLAVGLAGGANVIKNLVWQEGVLFKSDFLQGIKSNWRCFCLTAVLGGVLYYVANYLIYVGYFESGAALELGLVAILAAGALFALALPFVLVQSTLYRLPYLHKLSNGLLLSLRRFLPSLGIVAVNALPFLVLLVDDPMVHLIALPALCLLVLPALLLVDTLYVHSVLDAFVNKENFPEIYRKGLRNDAHH